MKVALKELELKKNGILVEVWFDLKTYTKEDIEEFFKELKEKHTLNSNLELFITDVKDDFTGTLKRDDSIDDAFVVQEIFNKLNERDLDAIKILLEYKIAADFYEALDKKDNLTCKEESCMHDVAVAFIEDTGAINCLPEELKRYFDYEALGRNMEVEGTFLEDDKGVLWEYIS